MSEQSAVLENPTELGPKPEFNEPPLDFPAIEAEMQLQPDYGEQSYRGSGKLTGRKALITGGDSGIGRAVALAFAREGADVLISYLEEEEEDARETARVVREAGRSCVTIAGDIGNEEHCRDLVQQAVQQLGGLDILVNNAAFQMSHPEVTELPSDEFDLTFKTNVYALYYLIKAAIPHLQPGSAIINTSSIEAFDPDASLFAYAATKAAIVNMTKSLAQDLIKKGIRVNSVAPGPVWTPLIPSTMPPEKVKEFGKQSPIGRPAQPAELAPVYVLLASQEASYVNGMIYGVTGGTPLF